MKTNDEMIRDLSSRSAEKMAKIDTFEFEAVPENERAKQEQSERQRQAASRLDSMRAHEGSDGSREYKFFDTSSVKRVDTETVHRMMTTSSLEIPTAPGGRRKKMTKKRMMMMLIPLGIIFSYILMLVILDISGLCGNCFRFSAAGVILYILYLALTFLGVTLLMFMDIMPKPLALLVIFISMFCMQGNLFLIIPLIIAFIAIAITMESFYPRVITAGLALFMCIYACICGSVIAKTAYGEAVKSEDGKYQLVMETKESGDGFTYNLYIMGTGTVYKKALVCDEYADIYYFGEGDTVAYGTCNQYGQPQTVRTVKIEELIK